MDKKILFQNYVDGWKAGDVKKILAPLSNDCVIIESKGPIYQGRDKVKKWVLEWHQLGNRVITWDVISLYTFNDNIVSEWFLSCMGKNYKEEFFGITTARTKDDKIFDLKEHRMTAIPLGWHPTKKSGA